MTADEDVSELFAGDWRQASEEQVVDDQQLCGLELLSERGALAELPSLVDVFDQDVRFAVQHLVTALDGEQREGLRDMAFAGTGLADQQDILLGVQELERGKREDVALRQFRVVALVELRRELALLEAGQRKASFQQSRASSVELVLDEPGDSFEEVALVVRDLQGARFERCAHARQPQPAQRLL